MQFSEEFIKKLKEIYPYSIFPKLAKEGDYIELQRYLVEEEPSFTCEEILEYINSGNVSELKEYAEERMKAYEKRQELYSMFLEEVENATGYTFGY